MATRTLYLIGKTTAAWSNRFEYQFLDLNTTDKHYQLGWAGWIVPHEDSPPAAARTIFQIADTDEIKCWAEADGSDTYLHVLIDGGANGIGEAKVDITSVYVTDTPFFLYVQYNAYGAADADKVKVKVNDTWQTLDFINPGVPSANLDIGYWNGKASLRMGQTLGSTDPFYGRMGQIRFFHGDTTAQDNPGLPSDSAIEDLYYFGLGEPSSVAGQSGYEGLKAEWLLTEQAGSIAADSSGGGHDASVGSGVGWGGSIDITVSLQPKLDSISIVDGTTIDVVFSKDMKQNSKLTDTSSYTVSGGHSVTNVTIVNSTTVRLTISPEQHTGDSLTVTVDSSLQDTTDQYMDPSHASYSFTAQGSHPTIRKAAAGEGYVRVWFSETMLKDDDLTDITNYSIKPVSSGADSVSILKVVPEPGVTYPRYVDLKTTDMTEGATYKVTAQNMKDVVRNTAKVESGDEL